MESNERKRNLVLVGVLALIVFVCVGTFSATAAIGYFIFGGSGGDARSVDIRIDEPDSTPPARRRKRAAGPQPCRIVPLPLPRPWTNRRPKSSLPR